MSDCAAAILRILENGKIGEIYNIGSGNERKNIAVVKTILDILGKPHTLIDFVQDRLGHDMRYSLNYTKLQKDLSWTPKIDFDTGIQETVSWYRNNSDWLGRKADYLRNYWKKVYKK